MSDEYSNKLYEQYSAQREKLDASALEAAGRYDKTVLAITTGALALSVTFIDKIASNPQHWTLYILVIGWFLLLASVILQLHALSSSHNSVRKQITLLDLQYSDVFIDDDPAELIRNRWNDPAPINPHIRHTHIYNVASKYTLIFGIVCILVFSSINVFFKKEADATAKSLPQKPIAQEVPVKAVNKYSPRAKKAKIATRKSNTSPTEKLSTAEEGEVIMTCKPTQKKPLKITDESYTPPVNKLPPPPPKEEK